MPLRREYDSLIRKKPLFALTMGDPAGIGPEILIKALCLGDHAMAFSTIVIGEKEILSSTARALHCEAQISSISSVHEFDQGGIVNVLDCGQIAPGAYEKGKPQKACGRAAYYYIEKAIEMALNREVDGVITNPISKEALHLAGLTYPGHTEIFAERTGTQHFSMLFLLHNVGVAHVTTHCSLRTAVELVTTARVLSHIRLLDSAMRQLGIDSPRIAVGGLNPHAGENGLFGMEEIEQIAPAVAAARDEGIDVSGPHPPDTVFMRAFKGEFDGVVAMLHDHGFVALKSLDFERGVNITIGLPILRTSVGHGTAFDIAGRGEASAESLLSAFDAAERLYIGRRKE